MKLKTGLIALALALGVTGSAQAVTLDGTNSIETGETVVLSTGSAWDFSASFRKDEGPGVYTFVFHNPYATARTLEFGATVREVSARFNGGAQVELGSYLLNSLGGSATDSKDAEIVVEARSTQTLTLTFGKVSEVRINGVANITYGATVAPVPVPAAGIMLLSGLAGFVGLRRRRKAA